MKLVPLDANGDERQARLISGQLEAEYLAGTLSEEDTKYLYDHRSVAYWIELSRRRYKRLSEDKIVEALTATGPDKTSAEKLDAVITLLAIIARA